MLKSIGWMSAGTIGIQIVSVVSIPILARIYGPQAFGAYAATMTAAGVLGLVSTLRLDLAIDLPKDQADARRIASACLMLATLVCGLTFVAGGLLLGHSDWIDAWATRFVGEAWLLTFVPIIAFLSVCGSLLSGWKYRQLDFKPVMLIRLGNVVFDAVAKVALSKTFLAPMGLVAGITLSATTLALQLGAMLRRAADLPWVRLSPAQVLDVLRQYRQFPLFGFPVVLMNHLYTTAPVWVIGSKFGAGALGLFYVAQRLAQLPEQALSAPAAQVFRRYAARRYADHGECRQLFLRTAALLVVAASVLFLPLYFLAEPIVGLLFGQKWLEAVPLARLLIINAMLQFVASPLTSMFVVAQRQNLDFMLSFAVLVLGALSIGISIALKPDAAGVVMGLIVANSIKYPIEVWLAYRLAAGK